MLRKPNATPNADALTTTFLLISFGAAIAVLATRNLYDDEILSLPVITRSARDIIRFSSTGDVHPPGMYLLTHFAWRMLPSFRWMNLIPMLVLYAGLAIFVRAVAPLFTHTASRVCFLLFATLHPQLLLWGTSFRWYSWWTGIALICITIAVQPRRTPPSTSPARGALLGLMLACLFYLNYITILFVPTLALAMLVRRRTEIRKLLVYYGVAGTVTLILTAPQMHTFFTMHLLGARRQNSGLLISFARLAQSLLSSEAYLPWHPLAIMSAGVIACLLPGAIFALRRKTEVSDRKPGSAILSLSILGGTLFLLVAGSGLGGKPRSGLLLIPVLAPAFPWLLEPLRSRTQAAILLLLALWSADGIAHMLGRYGLTKAMMIDRPEQVVAFVRETSAGGCSVVATYDPTLAFAITQANLPNGTLITPFPSPVVSNQQQVGATCSHPTLYAVQSYLGGSYLWQPILDAELHAAIQDTQGSSQVHRFSFDPDAALKRKLADLPGLGGDLKSAAELPDYRYLVMSGPIAPESLGSIRHQLKDFAIPNE